jgi:biopolymer transport protein ExbB
MKNNMLRHIIATLLLLMSLTTAVQGSGAKSNGSLAAAQDTVAKGTDIDALAREMGGNDALADLMSDEELSEGIGFHQLLKQKFVEGNAGFMSLVALALVLGLAFCIERLIYLTLSEVNARRLMADVDRLVSQGDIEGARQLCRDTRGPVASVCYQGLLHIADRIEDIERQLLAYGSVQAARLERGCSWIRLFITIAPSLGFLGTVIGMVMAFDRIQTEGDISPTIVAEGMKVALITTIFGIVVALVLQVFYNYIQSKIEHLTGQMEESAITLMDIVTKHKEGSHG